MLSVRAVSELDEFMVAPDDTPEFRDQVEQSWRSRGSQPPWAFVGYRERLPVARVGFRVSDTVSDPLRLGGLPAREMLAYGLAAWGDDPVSDACEALLAGLGQAAPDLPAQLDLTTNAAVHRDVSFRLEVASKLGLPLFQEKEGVMWIDGGQPLSPRGRLEFRDRTQSGDQVLLRLVSSVRESTLDRNDRYYASQMKAEDWAAEYVSIFGPPELTLIGFDKSEPAGFISIGAFEEPDVATIVFVGVAPNLRGRGHINEFLVAGTAVARTAGFSRILSDVDTENFPMLTAMERAGHKAANTPWHKWHHRVLVGDLLKAGS